MTTHFDKPQLKVLRQEIAKLLEPLTAQHGLKVIVGNCSFSAGHCKFALELEAPVAKAKEDRERLQTMCSYHGLDIDKVSAQGSRLVRYEATRSVRPWVVTRGGREYILTTAEARRAFGGPDNRWPAAVRAAAGEVIKHDPKGAV